MAKEKVRRRSRTVLWEAINGYLFISPWLIGFLVFVAGPLFFSLYTSFTDYDVTSQMNWLGLKNYRDLLVHDQFFWVSVKNTLYMTILGVPLSVVVGMVVASLLNQEIPGQKVFRTFFFLPKVLSGVAVLLLWLWVFNPVGGPINQFLHLVGMRNTPNWFNDPAWSKPAMIIMGLWAAAGDFLLYLAGLQGIPRSLYEAGEIDGATNFRMWLSITIPLLSPTIFFKVVTGISGSLQAWSSALIMTQGGPSNSTLFYGLYMYNKAFTELRMGYASAMAWLLCIVTLIITGIQFWGAKKWVYYESERR